MIIHRQSTMGESLSVIYFCNLVADNFLYQFIDEPTHIYIARKKPDLVFYNYPDVINYVNIRSPEGCDFPTDYDIIDFNINLNFQRNKPVNRKVFDVKKSYLTV